MSMRCFQLKSYVSEKEFLEGKDAHFYQAAFANCFVVDFSATPRVIASCRPTQPIEASLRDIAASLPLLHDGNQPLILPCPDGTLLLYPAWQKLSLSLGFLLTESPENVEKAYKNAQRYAFSLTVHGLLDSQMPAEIGLEARLCILQFYINRLFGEDSNTSVMAQMLMIARLTGCKLHEVSAARVNISLDEREMESFSAYLFCVLMTMRRYNGKISAAEDAGGAENDVFSTYVSREYGLRIQQSIRERLTKPTAFDLPTKADIMAFAAHPAFANYRIEQIDGAVQMRIPVRQKAMFSSVAVRSAKKELLVTLFPL